MKELSIEEKAKAYDKAVTKFRKDLSKHELVGVNRAYLESIFPELAESEDEKIRKWIIENIQETLDVDGFFEGQKTMAKNAIAWLEKQGKNNMGISEATKQELEDKLHKVLEKETSESWNEFLEEQGEQKSIEYPLCKTVKDKIDYYIVNHFTTDTVVKTDVNSIVKAMEEGVMIGMSEQNPAEWHREDEQNLNACLGYIPDEFLRRWLTNIIHVKYDKPADNIERKYNPYYNMSFEEAQKYISNRGFDIPWTDCDVFVDFRYVTQTVANILCWADNNPKQNPAWSEEDEDILNTIINHFKVDIECTDEDDMVRWLKYLKDRVKHQKQWKPTEEQIKALKEAVDERFDIDGDALWHLYNDLKKLREE